MENWQKFQMVGIVAGIVVVLGATHYLIKNHASVSVHAVPSATQAMPENVMAMTASQATDTPPVAHKDFSTFKKPDEATLRATLTPLQFEVTQNDGTEAPFDNIYDKNYDEGIYVDIVSGEPLYSSKDKYDSGTGWPSFVKPLTPDAITTKTDTILFQKRTEVRSRIADSHLGHVFTDGPQNRGGLRYCMNSAALRFIPKAELEKEGYGEYRALFM